MKLPVLYTFRRCPYAMRARISMYYSKISYEHREILLKERPKKLYQLSPKGTVPVLNLPDGKVIDESLDIMKWSVSVNDPDSWFVNNIDHQLDIISINDEEFLVLNKLKSIDQRLNVLATEFSKINLNNVFIPPVLREFISNSQQGLF